MALRLTWSLWAKDLRVMLVEAIQGFPRSAHVIVLGNEKGGSGKSTIAMHIAVALMKAGQRVDTIDLDPRQASFSRYVANRRGWKERAKQALGIPTHFCVSRANGIRVAENEVVEFRGFEEAICALEHTHDFVVIDTPGSDSYLMRLAHSMADTLVTPINDSYVDFDVLGQVDPYSFGLTGESHYAATVRNARHQRRIADSGLIDWIVMRNRVSLPDEPNGHHDAIGSRGADPRESLRELGMRLGFRLIDGFSERAVYRELFPRGLTTLDTIEETTLGMRPNLANDAARDEVMELVTALKLPIDERGRRRAAARQEWLGTHDTPLDVADVLA